jgi:hypothetical protein
MSDDVTKRDLKRDVSELKEQTDTSPILAFETENGRYVDREGNPIENPDDVVFGVPVEIWKQWKKSDRDLTDIAYDELEK